MYRLLSRVSIMESATLTAREEVSARAVTALPLKDRPILVAAIAAQATHLLTGDFKHFGPLYGKRIHGVLILSPSTYYAQAASLKAPKLKAPSHGSIRRRKQESRPTKILR